MKKRILLFFASFFMIFVNSYADKFIVESFEKDPNDLAARRHSRSDYNDKKCALLKIRTYIKNIQFDASFSIIGDVKYKNGEYWVYLSPDEKRLSLMKSDFLTKHYNIPVSLEPSTVYVMTLVSNKKYTISIEHEPENAQLSFDGKNLGTQKIIHEVSPGTHSVTLKRRGYRNVTDTIMVRKGANSFSYSLEKLDRKKVTIKSAPKNATILINNQNEGTTNRQLFLYPGKYNLILTKQLYETVDTTLVVKETGDNSFKYDMKYIISYLKINTDPRHASIKIDGKKYQSKMVDVEAGEHEITASAPKHYSKTKYITTKIQEAKTVDIKLKQKKGDLQVTTKPIDANVVLKKGEKVLSEWEGSKLKKLQISVLILTMG